ncbi:hypothetical protein HOP50_06g41910 [Chloropicon primus]|nr:hypothetical protein A3770_06p41810 [Chloropicon primus]UPR00874.1 hypothetical protein HOP50_06g41910 [Chloropicon primus]|eukprot:QDZ21663.1 hypothetical protein A3770_06p41810 [Chloropicon primus]
MASLSQQQKFMQQLQRVPLPQAAVVVTTSSDAAAAASSSKSKSKAGVGKRKWAPNRKAAGFWGVFNGWWRKEFERLERRPTTEEVSAWYADHSEAAWKDEKPTLKETLRHAKCLRTTADVRDYFRKYRAKRSGSGSKAKAAAKAPGKAPEVAIKPAVKPVGLNVPASPALTADPHGVVAATGLYDISGKIPAAAWIQPGQLINHAGQLGGISPPSDMLSAMYRNYAAAQTHQVPFPFVTNHHILYPGLNLGARNLAAPKVSSVQYVKPSSAKTEGSPNSTETTEPAFEHSAAAAGSNPTQQQQNDAALLSNMITNIEKSRALAITPTPAPWRSEEVSTAFQDDNNLEIQNIKLEYEPATQSIHILPPAVVESAESNGEEHYIDGL